MGSMGDMAAGVGFDGCREIPLARVSV